MQAYPGFSVNSILVADRTGGRPFVVSAPVGGGAPIRTSTWLFEPYLTGDFTDERGFYDPLWGVSQEIATVREELEIASALQALMQARVDALSRRLSEATLELQSLNAAIQACRATPTLPGCDDVAGMIARSQQLLIGIQDLMNRRTQASAEIAPVLNRVSALESELEDLNAERSALLAAGVGPVHKEHLESRS